MVWSMLLLLLHTPSLSRKQGSLTTDSSESCRMMLFSLSVFRFWYISWLRSCRKWLTLGLAGLPGGPPAVPGPWPESAPPLARSRQQLQQSRPMGERQSSSDISSPGVAGGQQRGRCRSPSSRVEVSPAERSQSHSSCSRPSELSSCSSALLSLLFRAAAAYCGYHCGRRGNSTHTQTHTHAPARSQRCRFSRSAIES